MEQVSLILACAGKSSRFIGKPKWLKTCPNGNLMIQECINGLDLENVDNIYITFLKKHIDLYCKEVNMSDLFSFTKKKIHVLILNNSNSQCETVYKTITEKIAVATKPLYKAPIIFLLEPSRTKKVPAIDVNIQEPPIANG